MATDDFVAMGNDKDYISFMEDSVMFGSYTGSSFTIEGMTSEQTDAGDTVLTTDEGTMTFTAEGTVVFASTDPEADVLTMMNPVYSYTEDPGAFTITGDTEDCAGYFVAFNQDGSMFGSEECDFFVLATDDFITLGNEDAYISIREDSVMYGSVVTGSNFTMENVIEQKKNGDIVVSMDGVPGYASFNADGSFVSNDGTADVLKILNTVYSYTEGDDGGFVITGNTKECADFFLMFNNDGFSYGSEACDLLVLATDDVVVIGNGDAYISMLEDSVMFGSSVTGSNFTIDGITSEANDDGDMVMSYEGGSSTFASDGSIVYTPTDSDADGSTLMNAVYTYTEEGDGGFVISGNTKDCDDFTYAFNADGVIMGSEDCGFLAGGDAEGGYVVTDDFIAFGNEDAFIAFAEDSVTFGSSSTGAKFTIDADVTETDDEGIMMSYDGGSTTFTADNTIVHVLGSDDPDAATITINNPVYDYTGDVFIISGDTKDCADLTLAFNAEGGLMGSKECGFLLKKSNEDAYIGFAEDSVMFGSYSTGSKFTIDADVTEIDEDIMMSYEGGSTTFAADNTVVLASSDPDADTLTINNPVYDYKDDAFIISGDIEGCDDFSLAFNNDGVVSGSKDCGFIAGGNEDGWMYASDDKIAVGNNEGSSEVLLNFGDDDGSCKTIRELLCESPAADSYTTVCELWTNSETVKSNEGVSMTVFVPTDDAFATLNDLLDQADVVLDSEANEKILMFHATPGMVMSTDLGCTGRLEMFNSGYSRTKCGRANKIDYLIQKGSGNRKNDMEPIIIAADIMACDESVIHIVSEVMLPNFIEDLA